MTEMTLREFRRLGAGGRFVAVTRVIPCDLETPVSCFLKIAGKEQDAFLLESAEQEEKIGRYSFIGCTPSEKVVLNGGQITHWVGKQRNKLPAGGTLSAFLEKRLNMHRLANAEALPDFCGGWVGYFGYENVADFESIKLVSKKKAGLPDGIFFLVKDFVIFDHFRKTLTLASIASGTGGERSYRAAQRALNAFQHRLNRPLKLQKSQRQKSEAHFVSNMTRQSFIKKVKRIKQYVLAGDCIQVVLSQRFRMKAVKDDFSIYRALRSINPSPHMFYFRSGLIRLIGSSPELLVKKQGSKAEVRPIAGTRRRGETLEKDQLLENQLRASRKEMAEHLMLVDLGRNDLGRVCEFKSVQVKDFAHVERFSHVMHLVSDVEGVLRKGKTSFDLLRAAFPAGTVTGAPKIRAMQIINEQEDEDRGPYAGCLGYFSFNRNMEMCITIRTLVQNGEFLFLQAGAGIVQDSKPDFEYLETVNKARALVKAVEKRGVFPCF